MKYKLFDPPRLTGKYLDKVLERKWLTTGPACRELRAALEDFFGAQDSRAVWNRERIVLASSATAGFQAVCDLVFDELRSEACIIRATWPGMRHALRHAGFGIIIQDGPVNVSVETDIGGRRLLEEYKIEYEPGDIRIHDACHSWLPDPSADFAIMSFYPTKLVPGAEGGVVICKREEDARELELRLNCGLPPVFGSSVDRSLAPAVVGRKGNLTDVQAALNLEALERAPQYMEEIAEAHRHLSHVAEEMGIPFREQKIRPYLFQVECEAGRVPELRRRLAGLSVPSAWNFPPAGLITLPCVPGLTREQAQDILQTYHEVSK